MPSKQCSAQLEYIYPLNPNIIYAVLQPRIDPEAKQTPLTSFKGLAWKTPKMCAAIDVLSNIQEATGRMCSVYAERRLEEGREAGNSLPREG